VRSGRPASKRDVTAAPDDAGSAKPQTTEACLLQPRGEVRVRHQPVAPKSSNDRIHPRRWIPPVPDASRKRTGVKRKDGQS
jgi:hypothetical protein